MNYQFWPYRKRLAILQVREHAYTRSKRAYMLIVFNAEECKKNKSRKNNNKYFGRIATKQSNIKLSTGAMKKKSKKKKKIKQIYLGGGDFYWKWSDINVTRTKVKNMYVMKKRVHYMYTII
jgi:hypothetical protein